MRRFAIPLALAALLLAAPAAAQIQPDVTVYPNATGTKVLLYPGGRYGRVQRPLLEPGEPDPNAPIVLHMPRKHAAAHRVAQAAKPKPAPKPVETAAIAPPPRPTEEVMPLNELPKESAARLVMEEAAKPAPARPKPAPAKPKPVVVAKQTPPPPRTVAAKSSPPPKPAPAQPEEPAMGFLSGDQAQIAPPRVASIEPPSTDTSSSQKSSILFAPGAEEPPQSALDTVRGMAASLSSALFSGSAHVQLEAYGGAHGDKGSDARRLSLKRALIIRQLLIDDGIPSERIVVRAMGGAPSGALDRVDIFVAA